MAAVVVEVAGTQPIDDRPPRLEGPLQRPHEASALRCENAGSSVERELQAAGRALVGDLHMGWSPIGVWKGKDEVVKRLREWRTEHLLSIRELAAAAEITPKTLTDLEYGRRRATYGTMRRISQALGVEPHEIAEFAMALASRGTLRKPDDADA
jgi:DNA-binding Xre family transcriptional regulator